MLSPGGCRYMWIQSISLISEPWRGCILAFHISHKADQKQHNLKLHLLNSSSKIVASAACLPPSFHLGLKLLPRRDAASVLLSLNLRLIAG